jgi:hypothetical protein
VEAVEVRGAVSTTLKCSEVERFADKVVLALTPLERLICDEWCGESGFNEVDLYRSIVSTLMRAKFGEPSREVHREGYFELNYACIDEELGAESEVGVSTVPDPYCGALVDVHRAFKSVEELKRKFGL